MLAIDKQGNLYIFEIKVWESESENILQALRYGQIFGTYDYEGLNHLFGQFDKSGRSMADAHSAAFGIDLEKIQFNRKQVLVTSRFMCHRDWGTDSLRLVFVYEDREEDAVH